MLQTETFENETRLEINAESIKTNLKDYNKNPYKCLFEYIWNAYDAQAETVNIIYKEDNLSFGGLKKLEIIDNGKGWDFNSFNTKTFLASSKKEISSNYKSIPHGRMGRGRYAFIWISDSIDILSGNKLLTLDTTTKYKISEMSEFISGTKVIFNNPKQLISNALIDNPDFEKKLVAEFGWFLKQNPLMQIKINGVNIDLEQSIEQVVTLHLADFSYQMQSKLNNDFKVKIILWKDKPNEFSKFYFLNLKNYEIFKENTGGNNNGDDFWHSIYIITDLFGIDAFDPNDSEMTDLFSGDSKHLKKNLLIEIKQKLVELRKPYLENRAQAYTAKLEKDKLLPNLQAYGVYDKPAFISLIEKAYTISPSLFKQKSDSEKKFICATFANLLSTQDNDLLQKIMNELADLSEEEKDDFAEILSRTKLSNIIKMTKIVDHRLDVIDKLKILITDFNKDTKEVLHLQKILNENFWIFGEQFELVSTTEGPLKKTLLKYAKEILMIENPELTTQPTGEVDLFLSKKDAIAKTSRRILLLN